MGKIKQPKLIHMVQLFESKTPNPNETIEIIDYELWHIKTDMRLYKVDFSNNSVKELRYDDIIRVSDDD